MRTFEVSVVARAPAPRAELDRGAAIASLLSVPAAATPAAPGADDADLWLRPTRPTPPRTSHVEQAYASTARSPRNWSESPGPSLGELPGGLASAPLVVSDVRTGEAHPMRFVAGLFGVVEDAAGTLSPEFGWAVTHDPPAPGAG